MINIPFSGNKRHSYKYVRPIVEEGGYRESYEPFGGSCVLTVNLYNDGIIERGFVNDYDHFFDNYEKYLDYKDWVVDRCFDHGLLKKTENRDNIRDVLCYDRDGNLIRHDTTLYLNKEESEYLQSLMKEIPESYWKYFTLGNNFVHSARTANGKTYLKDFRYFRRTLKTDKQRKYLEVLNKLDLTNLDYRDFFKKYHNRFSDKSILIVDPPYCETYQTQYREQFDINRTLKLLKELDDLKTDFLFFNDDSDKIKLWLSTVGISDYEIIETGRMVAARGGARERSDKMVYKTYS